MPVLGASFGSAVAGTLALLLVNLSLPDARPLPRNAAALQQRGLPDLPTPGSGGGARAPRRRHTELTATQIVCAAAAPVAAGATIWVLAVSPACDRAPGKSTVLRGRPNTPERPPGRSPGAAARGPPGRRARRCRRASGHRVRCRRRAGWRRSCPPPPGFIAPTSPSRISTRGSARHAPEDAGHVLRRPADQLGHDSATTSLRVGRHDALRRAQGEAHAEPADQHPRRGPVPQSVERKGRQRLLRPAEAAVHQLVAARGRMENSSPGASAAGCRLRAPSPSQEGPKVACPAPHSGSQPALSDRPAHLKKARCPATAALRTPPQEAARISRSAARPSESGECP